MHLWSLALFSLLVSSIAYLIFLLNCSLLHSFVVCRFLSVPLARFARLSVAKVPCFGARQGHDICPFVIRFLFCAAVVYLLLVLLIACVCLFFFGGHWFAPSKVVGLRFFCALVVILLS